MIEWFAANWPTCLAVFYGLGKNVKMTPTQYDDILLDIVWGSIKKALGKK